VASRFLYLDEATPARVGQPAVGPRLLVEETRAGGGKTVSTFDRLDVLGRTEKIVDGDGETTFTWDTARGKLVEVKSPSGVV
jgi:hypothetical protein